MKKRPLPTFISSSLIITLFFLQSFAFSQWSNDPSINNTICNANLDQAQQCIAKDGAGGAVIAWTDIRSGTEKIYAQRINNDGSIHWAPNGIPVTNSTSAQLYPSVIADGFGGVIVTWSEWHSGEYDIYAQRLNSAGDRLWNQGGVVICDEWNNQSYPKLVTDGAGGAIITWTDIRYNSDNDIYVQRIDSSGAVQWTADGVAVVSAFNNQNNPAIVSDELGGAIIVWSDKRNGAHYDIYTQRVNGNGSMQWSTDGISISSAIHDQLMPALLSDGSGGAFISWQDKSVDSINGTIYAQSIDRFGSIKWNANGIPLSDGSTQTSQMMAADGAGGFIVTWQGWGSGALNWDIYAQRVNSNGKLLWNPSGLSITYLNGNQAAPYIVSDNSGGAIITWSDDRNWNQDIYAQRINGAGTFLWGAEGKAISKIGGSQTNPVMVGDNDNTYIIAWEDTRNVNSDIYAQNIDKFGYFGINTPQLSSVRDVPADQGGNVTVAWERSELDVYPNQTVSYYSVWRGIDLNSLPANSMLLMLQQLPFNNTQNRYLKLNSSSGETYWEWVGNTPAAYFPHYSFTAPTTSDSTANFVQQHTFIVIAHTSNQFEFWQSNIDSGYSVDNLAPSAVQNLMAQIENGPSVLLGWDKNNSDGDVSSYEIHRSIQDGFTPSSGTLIGSTKNNAFNDTNPLSGNLYYRIITLDIHGNKSIPSEQVNVQNQITLHMDVVNKWNMVSVPLLMTDYSKASIFPTSVSDAFTFSQGYYTQSTLQNGAGYWLKFNEEQSIPLSGIQCNALTIPLHQGWNIVGSISVPVDITSITSDPPGIVVSPFFGFSNGYNSATTIEPGKSYWVKVSQAGNIMLSSPSGK